jgi:uncharacterized membrane protein (UPF0127 family)
MNRIPVVLVLLLAIAGLIFVASATRATQATQAAIEGFLTKRRGIFHTVNGDVEVDLEVTETAQEVEHGLMYRTAMPPKTGMLFVFPDEAERAFWMRNTLIPLDMLFINAAGRILHIEHAVPPKTEVLRTSKGAAQYVVELPGGSAQHLGIVAGDRFTSNL